jgi:xanthine dehydrogenase accessory factor
VGEACGRLRLDGESAVIIATPGHLHDFAAVRGALATEAGFIGLLGSRRKREALMATLAQEGFSSEQCGRIVTPVGLEIGAETPEEIAVSIIGQLIQERKRHETTRSITASGRRDVEAYGKLQAASPP